MKKSMSVLDVLSEDGSWMIDSPVGRRELARRRCSSMFKRRCARRRQEAAKLGREYSIHVHTRRGEVSRTVDAERVCVAGRG